MSSLAYHQGSVVVAHTHYWLILDLIEENLSALISCKELVQAVHDALIGNYPYMWQLLIE